jgi:probable phosphoglycerate mutase
VTVRRLLLVRHGETNLNADGRYVSSSDPDLSDNGRREVARLAQALAAVRLDGVWSSPKARCLRTAEAIVAEQGPRPRLVVDERLRELGFGAFEGMSPAELEATGQMPLFRSWRQGTPVRYPEDAESFEAAADRIGAVFDEIVQLDLDTVMVVGHSHALRILIAERILATSPEAHRRLRLDHAHVAELQWEDQAPRVVALNVSSVD